MAINWRAVIEDRAKFPDDARFTLGGEEISFGELRRQNAQSQGELENQLQARSRELDHRDETQRRAVDTLARVLENVSAATGLSYDQLVRGEIPQGMRSTVAAVTQSTQTASGVALRDDPLYKPLIEGIIAPMAADLGIVKQGLGSAITAYRDDHTRLAWLDYLATGQKPEGFNAKYEDALQLAVNRGYKDAIGFPDVKRAAQEIAGPAAQKADTTKVRQEGYDEGYRKARMEVLASMGQPQAGSGGISFESSPDVKGGQKRVQTIREKLDEAFNNPEIAGSLFTVQ